MPLAVPPNIAAYTYTGLLNYTGFIQTSLRSFGYTQVNQKYFDLMNMYGAIFIFTMFLFPYVYTITKAFWEKQSASLIESARILGRRPTEIFFTVALPISRVAIIGGVSLVMLETLNDYGVVDYFGIPTFSTAIFKTWFAMGDLNSAVRLSAILLLIVFNILMLEKFLRGRKRYSYTTPKVRPITPQKLLGFKGLLAFKYCFFVFSLGFLIPALQLLYWFSLTYRNVLDPGFWQLMLNSLSVALTATVLIIVTALIIANYCRINNHMIAKIYARITVVGYSIPGAVMVFQDYALFPHMTVEQNIKYGLQKLEQREQNQRLNDVLQLVSLTELKKRYPHELSGGQQQRVALARALAPKPSVLLLDEPFSNLDADLQYRIREELKNILKQAGITSIFVTHDREDAKALADRVIILEQGQIVTTEVLAVI